MKEIAFVLHRLPSKLSLS